MMAKDELYLITVDGEFSGLTYYYGLLSHKDALHYVKRFAGKTREIIGMKKAGA
jgi:hypothetical protein